MENAHVIDHPLIRHSLTRLRDVSTQPQEFRAIVTRLTGLLAYEATLNLEVESAPVQTPLKTAAGSRLAGRIGIIPILRAELGMAEGISVLKDLSPNIEIYVCSVDGRLNEQGYIVPGLGDAGNRMFNTGWENTGSITEYG